jgi:DNA-3-methyladenine glycosylase
VFSLFEILSRHLLYNTGMPSNALDVEFYSIPASRVARSLLGMHLVRVLEGVRLVGKIIETEAYQGEEDQACHARAGRTARTAVMYGPPGRAYIYFTYGMHWMLNVVCEEVGFPAAVLVRGVQPLEGLDQIALRRPGVPQRSWTDGPAKLCRAFGIDGSLNSLDLTTPNSQMWIEAGQPPAEDQVMRGPRVGIGYAGEPWLSMPWRFLLREEQSARA